MHDKVKMYVRNMQTNSHLTCSCKYSYTGSFFMTLQNHMYKIIWFSTWEWEYNSTENVSVKA